MRLLTERLNLRPLEEEDLDALITFARDRVQAGPDSGPCPTRDDIVARAAFLFAESEAIWAAEGWGPLAIMLNDALVGLCGFRPTPPHSRPSDLHTREASPPLLFYGVNRPFWRFGIAGEAADACLQWGFQHLGFARIDAAAHEDNIASRALLTKLGFQESGWRRLFGAHLIGFKACAPPAEGEVSAA